MEYFFHAFSGLKTLIKLQYRGDFFPGLRMAWDHNSQMNCLKKHWTQNSIVLYVKIEMLYFISESGEHFVFII